MKKTILISLLLFFALPSFAQEGLGTKDFAKQTGELIGQAKLCQIDTQEVNQGLIQSITVLAKYRKESTDEAIKTYQNSINNQLSKKNTPDCKKVKFNFEQINAKLNEEIN